MKWTNEINQLSSPLKKSSFLSSRGDFIKLLKHGTLFLRGAIDNLGASSLYTSKEVVYQNFKYLEKFKNSKILIIGAGPSIERGFDESEYDYIWSCNNFYKNENLKKYSIDLVTLGDEIDLNDQALQQYLNENKTITCFENYYTKPAEMKNFKEKYPDSTFWAMTRYHSRIGSIPRLVCMAVLLGVKEIHLIGMDGYVPKNKNYSNSTFEPNKKSSGTIEDVSKDEEEVLAHYREQYLAMWDYLLHDIGQNVLFVNLGHEHVCNLSTDVLTQVLGGDYRDYLYNPDSRKGGQE
tara:strand:+ start:333 stop:1211 length:879 start_codon:yes stop_codon:yes gene_type:complete